MLFFSVIVLLFYYFESMSNFDGMMCFHLQKISHGQNEMCCYEAAPKLKEDLLRKDSHFLL